jgi:hypothetical protein
LGILERLPWVKTWPQLDKTAVEDTGEPAQAGS